MAKSESNLHEQLALLLRLKRLELGISAREVARRAGVDNGTISRLERGMITAPTVESLTAIAEVLHIPTADIFAAAHWLRKDQLPTFVPYMRAKYPDMPADALSEIEAYAQKLAQQHNVSATGPRNDEDETPA